MAKKAEPKSRVATARKESPCGTSGDGRGPREAVAAGAAHLLTPPKKPRVWARFEQDDAAFKRDFAAWRLRYLERVAKARAARPAEEQKAAERPSGSRPEGGEGPCGAPEKDREAEAERQIETSVARSSSCRRRGPSQAPRGRPESGGALARRREKDRAAELERQIEASAARAVRAVAEKLLGSGPTSPASAKETPRGTRGRKPYPELKRHRTLGRLPATSRPATSRKAAENSAQWVVKQVGDGKLPRAVHHDTIRAWHRKVRG